jgi:hypothetical protein
MQHDHLDHDHNPTTANGPQHTTKEREVTAMKRTIMFTAALAATILPFGAIANAEDFSEASLVPTYNEALATRCPKGCDKGTYDALMKQHDDANTQCGNRWRITDKAKGERCKAALKQPTLIATATASYDIKKNANYQGLLTVTNAADAARLLGGCLAACNNSVVDKETMDGKAAVDSCKGLCNTAYVARQKSLAGGGTPAEAPTNDALTSQEAMKKAKTYSEATMAAKFFKAVSKCPDGECPDQASLNAANGLKRDAIDNCFTAYGAMKNSTKADDCIAAIKSVELTLAAASDQKATSQPWVNLCSNYDCGEYGVCRVDKGKPFCMCNGETLMTGRHCELRYTPPRDQKANR